MAKICKVYGNSSALGQVLVSASKEEAKKKKKRKMS